MFMKKYLAPEVELLEFGTGDVLNASGDNMDVGGEWDESWDRRTL